ncbi:hypothetical protein StoSoilB13_43300 (plasmid) [Arthrobacter sp. StoSoilB13]|nr:hypothetical protein StoSoilB13_43300 [Arthrobacter sp. StoSoilB13]
MQKDDVLVPGQVDIALNAISSVSNRLEVGRTGVFRERSTGAAVCVDLGPARGQIVASHAATVAHAAARTGLRWANAGEL